MADKLHVSKRNFGRRLLRAFVYLFIASLIYTLACRWIMPPVTLTQIGSVLGGYGLARDYVSWKDISPNAKLAAIASEDQLFPDHSGFDWKAMEKSIKGKQGKRKHKRPRGSGASTISQQAAKNVFLWQGSGIMRYIRKAPEAFYTKAIELVWGKRRILEVYLNVAEMGPGIFGIEAASRKYFGKGARNLSRTEAAMIIASLPNPKKYTVKPASRWVQRRHSAILVQMAHIESDPDIHRLLYK